MRPRISTVYEGVSVRMSVRPLPIRKNRRDASYCPLALVLSQQYLLSGYNGESQQHFLSGYYNESPLTTVEVVDNDIVITVTAWNGTFSDIFIFATIYVVCTVFPLRTSAWVPMYQLPLYLVLLIFYYRSYIVPVIVILIVILFQLAFPLLFLLLPHIL